MPLSDKYRPQFTFEEFILWKGRWELIEGMPYFTKQEPKQEPEHQRVNTYLLVLFNEALEKNCAEFKAYLSNGWKIDDRSAVQPDILIIHKDVEKNKQYFESTPSLIVEIVTSFTAFKDRHEKFELYEQEAVKYYLIVDPQFKKVEIFELIDGEYKLSNLSTGFEFTLESGCQFSINFDGIWP